MNPIAASIHAQARIIPISKPNKVSSIRKMQDGSLRAVLNSGKTIVVSQDDEMVQAFLVYTMLDNL